MERFDPGAFDGLQRRFGLARPGVRMIPEQRPPELPVREKLRRRLLLHHVLQPLLFQNRDLVGRQRRVHRHVGHEIDELRRELRQAADAQRGEILRDRRGERAAHPEHLPANLFARPALRAFLHGVGRHRGETGQLRRIAGKPRQDGQHHGDLGHHGLACDDHPQAV